jgi:hypothetical protein
MCPKIVIAYLVLCRANLRCQFKVFLWQLVRVYVLNLCYIRSWLDVVSSILKIWALLNDGTNYYAFLSLE